MSPHRAAVGTALAAATATLSLSLSACSDEGRLKSAGPTPTAVGPVRLWPGLPSVSAPPLDFGERDTARVPGIAVTPGAIGALSPVTVVRAEADAHPDDIEGPDGFPEQTAARLAECEGDGPWTHSGRELGKPPPGTSSRPRPPASRSRSAKPTLCPVLRAYRHDLTGDGRDELIVGVRMPDQQLAVRCYAAENGGLTRIMSTSDQIVGVELADRDLIVRVVSAGMPGYEYRTAWSWDARQGVMLPARDEIVPAGTAPTGSRTPPAAGTS
ncbi:hypothetical protein ACIOJD_02210 [Streptomyces sp. NPDC088116]|uniref:hypothetical protein n=1 Tax=Streptomyces sp. NPDC088116 TaxID=3365825 RepID=UPI00382F50F6